MNHPRFRIRAIGLVSVLILSMTHLTLGQQTASESLGRMLAIKSADATFHWTVGDQEQPNQNDRESGEPGPPPAEVDTEPQADQGRPDGQSSDQLEDQTDETADDPLEQETIDGIQLGSISVEPVYYGEVFTNARGGKSTTRATRYQGLLDLGLSFDPQKAGWRIPGTFFLLAQNTHGQGLTEDFVGDTQVLSNIDSFKNIMQVSEYWYEFNLLEEAVTIRLGKQDLNTEFLFIETAGDFIQSTFGLSPSTAFPTYPDQAAAAVALISLTDAWRLKAGVWNAFAKGGSFGFSGSDTVLLIGELERTYSLADGRLPGIFAIGAVYESAGLIDDQPVSPVHEYIVQFEQLVHRENPRDDNCRQGMAIFAGYYPRFPGDQIVDETIGDSFVAGVTYTGLFPGRDEDLAGAGVAHAELFRGGTNRETVSEVFYRAQLTPRIRIQPDLQYIASPSGIFPDALAVGLRFEVQLH